MTPKERPILFDAESIAAILAGRKGMTRRVIEPQPTLPLTPALDLVTGEPAWICPDEEHAPPDHGTLGYADGTTRPLSPSRVKSWRCPYGRPGDVLWCREAWRVVDHDFGRPYPSAWRMENTAGSWWANPPEGERERWAKAFGTAETTGGPDPKRRHGMFMPRWASRITLEVVGVKVERVQDISRWDIVAEGAPVEVPMYSNPQKFFDWWRERWDSINEARPGCSYVENPWVWAVAFRVVTP